MPVIAVVVACDNWGPELDEGANSLGVPATLPLRATSASTTAAGNTEASGDDLYGSTVVAIVGVTGLARGLVGVAGRPQSLPVSEVVPNKALVFSIVAAATALLPEIYG